MARILTAVNGRRPAAGAALARLAHLARISRDRLGLAPPRDALSHDFLAAIAWIEGRNFLAETGARPLTGPAYGGRMSEDNARLLARFNARIRLSAGPFRVGPVVALAPYPGLLASVWARPR